MRSLLPIVLAAPPAAAQLQQGDLLVQHFASVFSSDPIEHWRTDGTLVASALIPDTHTGAAIDPAGNWVTCRISTSSSVPDTILVFDPDGTPLATYPVAAVGFPQDVDVFSDGRFAVSDLTGDRVHLFSPTGGSLGSVTAPGLDLATGLHVDGGDGLWVCGFTSQDLHHFDSAGTLLGSFDVPFRPAEVDMASDGTLWVADYDSGRAYHYEQDGTPLGSVAVTPFGSFAALGVGADDTLWAANNNGSTLRNYDTGGTLLGSFDIGDRPGFLKVNRRGVGARYCSPAGATSTGSPGRLSVFGSAIVAQDSLTLLAQDLPAGEFGYFLVGAGTGQFSPPASQGVLCLLGGTIGRFSQAGLIIQGPAGSIAVDLASLPLTPVVGVQPGDTWNFQCWFRDQGSSNFTDAISVSFL